jgi:hypothetical protein
VGVAPAGLVTFPGGPSGNGVPLEENHSHFVLADSTEWGGETGLLMAVAAALAGGRQVVVVLAGGGEVARAETLESVRRGWPVFAIGGTGGLADLILRHRGTYQISGAAPVPRSPVAAGPGQAYVPPHLSSIEDACVREIVSSGDIRPATGDGPGQLARELARELQDERVLKGAWQ